MAENNSMDERNRPEATESIGTKVKKVEVSFKVTKNTGNLPLSTLDDERDDR